MSTQTNEHNGTFEDRISIIASLLFIQNDKTTAMSPSLLNDRKNSFLKLLKALRVSEVHFKNVYGFIFFYELIHTDNIIYESIKLTHEQKHDSRR